MKQSSTRVAMLVVLALATGACGPDGAKNLQEAGATADAKLATAGPELATAGAKAGDAAATAGDRAGDAAATAGAAAGPAVATMGAEAGKAAGTVEAKLDERLVARVWQWQETTTDTGASVKPTDPAAYTITFVPGGTLAVKADCKSVGGTYSAEGAAMKLDVKVTTTDACPDGSMADAFVEQLTQVSAWKVDSKLLKLPLTGGAGTMRFEAP